MSNKNKPWDSEYTTESTKWKVGNVWNDKGPRDNSEDILALWWMWQSCMTKILMLTILQVILL